MYGTEVVGTINLNNYTLGTGAPINVTVMNSTLSGGTTHNVQFPVTSGDESATTLAQSLAGAILADSVLSGAGISASSNGPMVYIIAPATIGTVCMVCNSNGPGIVDLSGSAQAGDVVSITVYNPALTNGQKTESYTVVSGNTLATIAQNLASQITADMSSVGISATYTTSPSVTVKVASTAADLTFFTQAVTGTSPTEEVSQESYPIQLLSAGTSGGAGKLHATTNSAIANSTATYNADVLGRVVNRSINGPVNSSTFVYDPMGRVTSESNPLGTFDYYYVDDTSGTSKGCTRLSSIGYPNGQTTNFSWLPNIGDQRLQQIENLNPTAGLLSQFNYAFDAAGEITQWQQQQNSTNTHQSLGYDLASQLTSAQSDSGSGFNAYISGTVHAGDVVAVTGYDASLTGTSPPGQETASYTVMSGDTLSSVASSLASSISSTMSNISVSASATGSVIAISTSAGHATQFTATVSGTGATDTISLSGSDPASPLHMQLYYMYDVAGNRTGVQGDSSGSFPTGLTTSVNQSTYNNLNQVLNTSAGGPIAFQATTTNPISTAVINVTQTATIGGTAADGDVVTISVHDAALGRADNVGYTVTGTQTPSTIASQLTSMINADPILEGLGVSATSSGAVITITSSSVNLTTYTQSVSTGATETIALSTLGMVANVSPSQALSGNPILSVGANTASITAFSGGGARTTNTYPVTVSSASSQAFSYDADGNMTNVTAGTYPQYKLDAENRLIEIVYDNTGDNFTSLTYDPMGRCASIVETTSGSISSTKQFVWCGNNRCEVRDGSNNLLNQYFSLGQVNFSGGTGTNEPYTLDHLGNVREMGHGSGGSFVLDSQFGYDPFGNATQIAGSGPTPDFTYAGMYVHQRSGLNLTMFRAYSPTLGRWLSRDPLGESGGTNLYAYVGNNPIGYRDPLGRDIFGAIAGAAIGLPLGITGGAVVGGGVGVAAGAATGGITIPITATGGALGGAAIGAGIGVVGGAALGSQVDLGGQIAGGIQSGLNNVLQGIGNVLQASQSNPLYGQPNSTSTTPNGKQTRTYDENGNPEWDIDQGHPNESGIGGQGHVHPWDNSVNPPKRGPSESNSCPLK